MDAEFCIEALRDALMRYGTPEIFNTDQGSQFTTPRFTGILEERQIRISMDGRGRWLDNVFIERLWRSLKYECVYLHAFETGSELRRGFLTLEAISGHFVEFSHPTGARSGILTILCFWRRVLNAVRVSRPEKAVLVEAMWSVHCLFLQMACRSLRNRA